MDLLDRLREWLPTKNKTVLVPEGYRIIVVKPSPDPAFDRTESGFWIANLGSQEYIEPEFKFVENIIRDDPKSSVIWVLQKGLLDYWAADTLRIAELLRRFYRIQQFRIAQGSAGKEMLSYWPQGQLSMSELLGPNPPVQQRRVADIAVVASSGSNAQALITLLGIAGIPAHLLGPENDIFVEIHRPDKIIVDIPGSRMEYSSEQTFRQLHLERDKIEKSLDAGTKLIEIEKRELAFIEKVIHATTPFVGKFLSVEAKISTPLLSGLIEQYSLDRDPKVYKRFVEAFLQSKVGVQISGGTEKAGHQLTSTSEAPIEFNKTASGDGRERILVCADPPVYAMRFGDEFNSLVGGDELLKVVLSIPECAGVHVNSALSDSGMLISRETAISVLKS